MLFVKRLLTALIFFGILFVVVRTAALVLGGGIAGAKATSAQQAQNGGAPLGFNDSFSIGAKAGVAFREQYGQTIGIASLAVATVGALWLSFGGVLPWCREVVPPPLPGKRFG